MQPFRTESKPAMYRLTRLVVKLAMAVFFRKIELRNGECVPKRGPIIFVANHPNSIMDALVMGVVTKRKVNYIGHVGLFSSKLKSWFLRSTGVIPVYRREDAPDKMEQNVSMFDACYQALEAGETIGIFPEGTSDMLRKVKKLKTGAARIILETERRNDYNLGVTVLPVGLYFFSRSRFRSRVLVNIGAPVDLLEFFELNQKDNVQAVQALTDRIQTALEKITVNIQHEELDEFVHDLEILYRDELKAQTPGISKASKETVAEFFLTQKIAECVEYYHERDPQKLRSIQEKVVAYKRKLDRLHLKDAMLKEQKSFSKLFEQSAFSIAKAVIGFPLALYGVLNNVVPYLLAEQIAKKFIDERTKILSALLIGGGFVFVLCYAVQVSLVWFFTDELWAGAYFLSLPASGLFGLAYLKEIRQDLERVGLGFFLFTNRQLFNKMRRERRILLTELDAVRDEYLRLTSLSVEMK